MSEQISFASNKAAFEYACRSMDYTVCENAELPALVISTRTFTFKEFRCIRLNVACNDGELFAIGMVNQNTIDKLDDGDFVAWDALKIVPFGDSMRDEDLYVWLGMVTDKLYPLLDAETGWVVDTD